MMIKPKRNFQKYLDLFMFEQWHKKEIRFEILVEIIRKVITL
jgi:hypothetical protein